MDYKVANNEILVSVNVANSGKFRFKKRVSASKFGESFATRQKVFDDDVYLEWQIGYDATKQALEQGKKQTKLSEKNFIGFNKKTKFLYELSELVFQALKLELISKKSLEYLLSELKKYREFLSERKINVKEVGSVIVNGLSFEENFIQLPTFFLNGFSDGSQIEVSIQKQQYATGVQPMLYLNIPLRAFSNGKEFHGRVSIPGDKLVYVINNKNAEILSSMLRVFGMASPAHNHDIIEIIKVLLSLL